MTIRWKSIINIKWNEELIEEIKEYLKNETLPKRLDSYHKKWKFNRTYNIFSLGDDNKIYLIVNEVADVPPYFKDENGNVLFDVQLPMKFRVVDASNAAEH